jgi:hypothetical protein
MVWIMMSDIFLNLLNNRMIYNEMNIATNHIAYLRHTNFCLNSNFYPYAVPTGQVLTQTEKSFIPKIHKS